MKRLVGLGPWAGPGTRVLVLGSFPSAASLAASMYYGHGRNHFWPLMAAILGGEPGSGERSRRAWLEERGIGLWDVLASCGREGSLDQDIRDARPNDIAALVERLPRLSRVLLNGSFAARAFRRAVIAEGGRLGRLLADRGIGIFPLPSTSPVPSRNFKRMEDKLPAWRDALADRDAAAD